VSTADAEPEPDTEQDAEAEPEPEPASGPLVETILEADYLKQYLDTLRCVAHEGRIHFDDDGAHARIVDPAIVAMVFADLSSEAFESYEVRGRVTVGLNLNRLNDALSVADAGDLVHLAVDMERRVVSVEIGHVDQTVRLLDPETIRSEPDLPDLDLPNRVVVEGRELDTVITVTKMVSDHLLYECDPDAAVVRCIAEGDVDDSVVTWGHDQVLEASVDQATETYVSLNYVEDLFKPIGAATEVEIRLGDEFPVIWEWTESDGHQETLQMLAPRILTQ